MSLKSIVTEYLRVSISDTVEYNAFKTMIFFTSFFTSFQFSLPHSNISLDILCFLYSYSPLDLINVLQFRKQLTLMITHLLVSVMVYFSILQLLWSFKDSTLENPYEHNLYLLKLTENSIKYFIKHFYYHGTLW